MKPKVVSRVRRADRASWTAEVCASLEMSRCRGCLETLPTSLQFGGSSTTFVKAPLSGTWRRPASVLS